MAGLPDVSGSPEARGRCAAAYTVSGTTYGLR
jgi:hypothetical protein